MSKKIYVIISIIACIIIIFSLQNQVYASAATMSVSATKVDKGKSVTITANISSAASWDLDISATGGNLKKNNDRVGNTNSGENENKTITLGTFSSETPGSYKITLSGYVVDGAGDTLTKKNVNDEVTIVVEETVAPTPTDPGNSETTQKSTEAKLSNLGITPNDFKGFKKDKYTYTHEVPYSVSEVTVYAEPVKGATVTSGTGKVALKEGESKKIEVVVTAEAGNTKTYTLTIKRRTEAEEAALSGDASDASLKSLGIKPEEYDFSGFQKDKTEYSVEVPEDVEEIEVYAEATNSKALISGTGKVQLENGKNKLIVQVTAEDGTTRTYTIEVTRGGTEATATNNPDDGFGLSSLEVNGLTLTPNFKTGTYEYTIDLTEDLSSLDLEAIATDEDATIEILGNENLQQGENTITILVRNEETDETATYQIIVNKNITAEEKMSWLKPSTWGREEIIKVAIIAVLVILIIIAIILKIKLAKEKNNDKDIDLPGGDELDKALAEHQELAEADELEEVERTEGVSEFEEAERQEGVSKLEENKIQEESNFDENEISKEVADSDGTNYIEDIARRRNYKIDYQDNDFSNNSSKRKGKHF